MNRTLSQSSFKLSSLCENNHLKKEKASKHCSMCPEERDKLQDTEVTGTVREHAERNLLRKTATEEQ